MVLLTRREVAERLGVSYNTAGTLMQRMPVVMVGKRERVTEEALSAWMDQQTLQPIRLVDSRTKTTGLENGRIPLRKSRAV